MRGAIPRTVLVILDGWGEREERAHNAIRLARTPAFDALRLGSPHTLLAASGEDVGLPAGLMGNSEVGHLNIGAGRVVHQDIQRITRAIRDRSFYDSPALAGLMEAVRARGKALHLLGLVSDGGVHSLDAHLVALVEMAAARGVEEVLVHAFLDGRDTPPFSAPGHLRRLERELVRVGRGRIATVSGRWFAMDRDRRWERTERAWRAVALGEGERAPAAEAAVKRSHDQGVGDEFVPPTVIGGDGEARGMRDGDGAVLFNFRADRARQLTRALVADGFDGFPRPRRPRLELATMTEYDATLGLPVAFPPLRLAGILADVLAAREVPNLRLAETEKYAHVTYFFNGGVEEPWPLESRRLVPSPKVATYDLQPEMSAPALTDALVAALAAGEHAMVIANYANADMVGHTGVLAATVRAVEALDACLARVVAAADAGGWTLALTADHGNAELMVDPRTGEPHTAHTTNPVPLVLRSPAFRGRLREGGRLADVAPTLLDLWGVGKTAEMTGESLLAP